MAYEKHEWTCGETITADLLNNLEGGVEQALECCSDKDYECSGELITLVDETVNFVKA